MMITGQNAPSKDKYKHSPYYLKFAAVLVGLIALVYILNVVSDPLVSLLFAALFSILLHPICLRFEKWGVPRILSIVLSIVIFFIVLIGLAWLVVTQVSSFGDALPTFAGKAETFMESVIAWIEQNFAVSRNQQVSEGKKYLLNMLGESRNVMAQTVVAAGALLGTAVLVPLYVFFFLLYRDFFRQFVYKAFKDISNARLDHILNRIYEVIQNYMSGLVLVIGIVGILNTVGLWALGVDYAIFFGFLAAFLILIPYIGIFIGSLLPAFYSLVTMDNPWISLGVIGVMSLVQFLEGNFITPNIIGSKVSINPLAAIIMLLLGGKLWGLAGLILALPMTAILKVILDSNPDLEPIGYLLGEPEKELKEERSRTVRREFQEDRGPRKKPYRNKRRKPAQAKNEAAGTEGSASPKAENPKSKPEA
jgi:predicted PurR-regulated permease PerM